MRIEWTDHAIDLLDEQLSIITAARCREDAARWLSRIEAAVAAIDTFPEAYPLSRVPALAIEGIHVISIKTYKVYYIIGDDVCHIISIRRAAMNVQSPLDL